MEAVGLSLRNPNPPKQPQKTALPTNGPKGLASAKGSFCILSHDSQSRAASVHTLMRENMWNITLSWDRLTPLSLNGQGASGDLQSPAYYYYYYYYYLLPTTYYHRHKGTVNSKFHRKAAPSLSQ